MYCRSRGAAAAEWKELAAAAAPSQRIEYDVLQVTLISMQPARLLHLFILVYCMFRPLDTELLAPYIYKRWEDEVSNLRPCLVGEIFAEMVL